MFLRCERCDGVGYFNYYIAAEGEAADTQHTAGQSETDTDGDDSNAIDNDGPMDANELLQRRRQVAAVLHFALRFCCDRAFLSVIIFVWFLLLMRCPHAVC